MAAAAERQVTIVPVGEIGYTTGDPYPYGYPRTRKGLYTRTGVGVGVGSGGPGSTPDDRRVMEIELSDKDLPEGKIDRLVAGHLYFPVAARKRADLYQLEWQANGETLTLELKR